MASCWPFRSIWRSYWRKYKAATNICYHLFVPCLAFFLFRTFLYVFSTAWFAYALIVFFAVCCYFVHTKQSIIAAIIGFLIATFTCYCGEECFVLFLSYGAVGLIFQWKTASKLEKGFLWSLIATTLIFLILYYFICFIHIEEAYDGAHGTNVTFLENAVKMLIAQKVLWLGVVVLFCGACIVFLLRKNLMSSGIPWSWQVLGLSVVVLYSNSIGCFITIWHLYLWCLLWDIMCINISMSV